MPKPKRTIFRVHYKNGQWDVMQGKEIVYRCGRRGRKTEAVNLGRQYAQMFMPSQLVIHLKNGRIQSEHTYPRSSDPQRSKG